MKYLEMLDILGGADSSDSLRRAIAIPPSDPAHELAWIQAAEVLNRHSRAIVDYVNERMAEPDTHAPEDRPESWGFDPDYPDGIYQQEGCEGE